MPRKAPTINCADFIHKINHFRYGKIIRGIRLHFQGHLDSGILLVDRCRDLLASACFAIVSRYLKSLTEERTNTILLNTCSLSPMLATIAHWADWSLHRQGFNGNIKKQPKLIFVKADILYLRTFYEKYLLLLDSSTRYILISGDSDATIPRQVDRRFASHDKTMINILKSIHDDPRLIHWYAQNLDESWAKQSPIPLGFWESGGTDLYREILKRDPRVAIREKQLKVFCAHRLRLGSQWQNRRLVTKKALNEWKEHVDYFEDVPPSQFFNKISHYAFVMCVGGGGLDPSPKAWTALMAGSIPIIEVNKTTEAYRGLPVIFVESWETMNLNFKIMHQWREMLAPHFEQTDLRIRVLEKLSMGYWIRHIRRNQ